MSTIDLHDGRERFEASTDFTVGIEEEFAILDPGHLNLVPRFEELGGAAAADPVLAASVAGELIASEIEITSGRGETFERALAAQREHRHALFALAREHGLALGASGTHPWADYREQRIIDTDHYHRVEQGLKYVAWRNNTFSLHVHVGINGADRAVKVCDRLRPVLPVLLAISGNSPFLDGRDSGLASARSQVFTRNFPRCGVPDVFGEWRQFAEYIDFLVKTGSIVEYTQVWWSVRPHLAFGTVEVRICDVQATAAESDALAGLIAACVAQAAREVDEGRTPPDLHPRLIEENMWRAIRYGLDGELLDLAAHTAYPASAAADRLLEWTAEVRRELQIECEFPAANGAQRQRALLSGGMTIEQAFRETVAATHDSYAQRVEVQ